MNSSKHDFSLQAIEQANLNPGGWVYQIEGDYGPDDAIPPHAIVGAWQVDANGNIMGEFIANPNFQKPSNKI